MKYAAEFSLPWLLGVMTLIILCVNALWIADVELLVNYMVAILIGYSTQNPIMFNIILIVTIMECITGYRNGDFSKGIMTYNNMIYLCVVFAGCAFGIDISDETKHKEKPFCNRIGITPVS